MSTTNKLEQNNINTQLELMGDIIINYGHIIYHINARGKELRELLATKKINEPEKTVTLSKETFDKMLDIAYMLQDERKFTQLGSLAESAVPDNELKKKILNKLRA